MNNLNELIIHTIETLVHQADLETHYRRPLVGFARARHPLFGELRQIAHEKHLHPSDLLDGAQTVVSFFLPFGTEIVSANQQSPLPTRAWAQAKKDTEALIEQIIAEMRLRLAGQGFHVSDNPAKEPYDRSRFAHRWSQKHIAYICGLGNFGLHHLLITERGCAGRLGSFVIDAETAYSQVQTEPFCTYRLNRTCRICVEQCPAHALSYEGIDKAACRQWIIAFTEQRFGGEPLYRSCGKCMAWPCALQKPPTELESTRNHAVQ